MIDNTDIETAKTARTAILGRVSRGQGKAGTNYTLDERLAPREVLSLVTALVKLEQLITNWTKPDG